MSSQIVVPPLGESVAEATVAKWYRKVGESVRKDETLVELETDKVTLEVNALASGVLKEIKMPEGSSVKVGTLLGIIEEGAVSAGVTAAQARPTAKADKPAPVALSAVKGAEGAGPAARKLMTEQRIDPASVTGTGKAGRIIKADVLQAPPLPVAAPAGARREQRVKMSKLRQVIAKRLKDSQNTAAMLTTFNEIDMSAVLALREQYKDNFEKRHGVKLGFMSFFTKAVIHALKEVPAVNAEINGDEIVYKQYYDIGMAVGTPQGLVVPIVRNADALSFAGIEQAIAHLAQKARDGQLAMQDLQGGTFTITNGGVYGSLLSTPIINPPQSAILGLHKIEDRAVAVRGEVKVHPMMYVALSYDHRLIDGREAVTFLVKVKEAIESPQRLLLEV